MYEKIDTSGGSDRDISGAMEIRSVCQIGVEVRGNSIIYMNSTPRQTRLSVGTQRNLILYCSIFTYL